MMCRLHIALFLLLIGVAGASASGAAQASVSGVVRDSGGIPQIGAQVQLLRADLSVIASAYTNSKGRFAFNRVDPGRYAVKAMGVSFIPSLRENVRVHTNTVVNLTLNTLYEVMQWLPAEPRSGSAQKDDWAWTLRSAANRPLLRWLEDGPLVAVSEGPNDPPKLKARLIATGRQGTFGEDGERISVAMEDTPADSRELLASVDFDPATNAGMESMLGFRQDLGFAGSVQSLAAIAIHPEIDGAGGEGLDEVAMRSSESMNLGDEFQAEVGAEQVLARFTHGGGGTALAALPFLTVGWRGGDTTIHYRLATAVPRTTFTGESQAGFYLPSVSIRNGNLAIEQGLHQEIGWERKTGTSGMSVLLYADTLSDPTLEAMSHFSSGAAQAVANALYDPQSGLVRSAGPSYSTTGVAASVERRLPHGNHIRVSYANGDALVLPASQRGVQLNQILVSAHPRRAQMYSLSLSGTLDGSGTRWRASYRWQPEDTVTSVAPFAADGAEPFLNFHLRQPICHRIDGSKGLDAMVDVRNLAAQGYHPFVMTDGSLLVFAQDQRGVGAGLAFTF